MVDGQQVLRGYMGLEQLQSKPGLVAMGCGFES